MIATSKQRLTPREAEALWRAWHVDRDKAARDRLVLAYSPMVEYVASRKVRELPTHAELDDLVSYGLVALIEAVDRFDPTKGATFEQYAWTRVAGALMDELRRQDWASRSVRRTGRRIERERDAFYAREGVQPTEAELAEAVSLTVAELRTVAADVDRADVGSLNAPVRMSAEAAMVEVMGTVAAQTPGWEPENALFDNERMDVIRNAVAAMSERERDVLALVHIHQLPGAEIGRMLGVSESRVSQILGGVKKKLQSELAEYDSMAAA